jgi:hypothetical protein
VLEACEGPRVKASQVSGAKDRAMDIRSRLPPVVGSLHHQGGTCF